MDYFGHGQQRKGQENLPLSLLRYRVAEAGYFNRCDLVFVCLQRQKMLCQGVEEEAQRDGADDNGQLGD